MRSTSERQGVAIGIAAAFVPSVAFAAGDGWGLLVPKIGEFLPALVAFVVIAVVGTKLTGGVVAGAMNKRQEKIQSDIDAAAKARTDAEAELAEAIARNAEAQQQIAAILVAARADAAENHDAIVAKANADAEKIVDKARRAAVSERKKAIIDISNSTTDLAVDIAGKLIENTLTRDEHYLLIEKYLLEVGNEN